MLFISLAPFASQPILIPVLAKLMKHRTSSSLNVLLNNMAVIAVGE